MRWTYKLRLRLQSLFGRGRVERELADEVRFHLEKQIEENRAKGMTSAEARHAAMRQFGGVEQVKEKCRDTRGVHLVESTLRDVRYGLRQLRRSPGFVLVAVLTLALGIGANTAIFTLVDQVMLYSLPVAHPSQLFRLGDRNDCCVNGGLESRGWDLFPFPLYRYLRDHTPEFSDLAAFQAASMHLAVRRFHSSGLAKPFQGEFVSGNYFRMFGIGAWRGRVLTPEDDRPGAPPVAVMSYHAWQQDFGLDPSVIGGDFAVNTVPFTVIGVAPPGFFGDRLRSNPPDFWLPLSTEPTMNGAASILNENDEWLYSIGRLQPGAQPRQVQSQLTVELRQWLSNQADVSAQSRQEIPKQFIPLAPAGGGVQQLQSNYSSGLSLLMILAGVVLLIACANVANLLLARGAASRLNTAVRVALGAPRRRLIRQALTETVLLAIIGGLAGLYVAYAGARAILMLAFRGAHHVPLSANPSLPVLGFAFALSLLTGIVFGFVPAWVNSRSDPAAVLRAASRSSGEHASFARRALVVLQVAMCVVLLACAGLLTESLRNLQNQPYGFQTRSRWIVKVNPALAGIKPDQLYNFYQQLEERLSRIPGVLSASYSLYSPMEGKNWAGQIQIEGRGARGFDTSWLRVGPHYFETIGTPLIRGRAITDHDTPTSRGVAVVNQAFARKYFPHQDPIGQHFGFGGVSHAGDYEIVGVVGDAKYGGAREPAGPTCFIPFLQDGNSRNEGENVALLRSNYMGSIELRVDGKPKNLEASVRRALATINPNLTVLNMMTFGEQLSLNFNQDRLMARLTELFGLLALALACVGLYGVTSYSVARRTNEIGIRMALGAEQGDVLRLVVGQGLRLALVGVAAGVAGALALTRFLSSLLYGVKPYDPLTFLAVSTIAAAVALLASYVPARRAMRVDPMTALRHE